jgi:glycosyltransferase involved in cell wall biosynthesis
VPIPLNSPNNAPSLQVSRQRLRIAHLVLSSHFAGSERYAVELANAQSERHDVTVILSGKGMRKSTEDSISARLDSRVIQHCAGKFFRSQRARWYLQKIHFDIAHAHLSTGCRSLAGLREVGARIATLHLHYKPQQHAHLDALIAIAPWQLQALPATLRERSVQINNWTLPQSVTEGARQTLRESLGIKEYTFVVGAIGRLEKSKGFDVLIDAFARAAMPNSALIIVGQGREQTRLSKQAGKNVFLPGFSSKPADWLACFDGFVSPSRYEPFGLVLLEAMQAGLPILASASAGASYLQPHFGSALVPTEDVDALAGGLRARFLPRPPQRQYDMHPFAPASSFAQIEDFYYRQIGANQRQSNSR